MGLLELFGTDAPEDELASSNIVGAIAVGLAVIVVAPVTEELFFRGFFYRALRTRMRVVWAVLIDSLVFASIHVQYIGNPEIFIVIGAVRRRRLPGLREDRLDLRLHRHPRHLQHRGQPGQLPGGGDRDRPRAC